MARKSTALAAEKNMQAAMAAAHDAAGNPVLATFTAPDGTVIEVVPFIHVDSGSDDAWDDAVWPTDELASIADTLQDLIAHCADDRSEYSEDLVFWTRAHCVTTIRTNDHLPERFADALAKLEYVSPAQQRAAFIALIEEIRG